MTCKKCGHKFCWKCLQERPRESDAHDCVGAPDVASFDPRVQHLIRRVLKNYDASVENRGASNANPLAADAAALVTFAAKYLRAESAGWAHDGSKAGDAGGGEERGAGAGAGAGAKARGGKGKDALAVRNSVADSLDESRPDAKAIEGVQKVLARLRRLWEGRGAMFEALAQEQVPEGGDEAAGALHQGLHRRLQRRREEVCVAG